jgi:hypothetical protein
MRKTYHRARQYSQLAEFAAAKCKKYEMTEQVYIIVTLKNKQY